MRIIKLGIISVIVFSIVLLLISLLIPSNIRISRAIDIRASKSAVYDQIARKENWAGWNDLAGEQITVNIVPKDSALIETTWTNQSHSVQSNFTLEESAGITVVQWYFEFHLKWYPWEKIGSITFDKQFGPPMEQSLNNLKKRVENSR